MREFTSPVPVDVPPTFNVVSALFNRESRAPRSKAFARREGDRFVDITLEEFCADVRTLAAGLVGLGIEPGSRVCLFSHTRYEFTLLDYAILAAGCVVVPIYETDSAEQVRWVATNSGAVAIFVENDELKANVDQVINELPDVRHVFVIEDGGLDEVRQAGASVAPEAVEERWRALRHDDLASIVYTSGTTGLPKGCMLTHGNFASEVRGVSILLQEVIAGGASTLMFLPLAHVLARVVQFTCVSEGVTIGYATAIKNLLEELAMFPPTFLFAVPRVLEKVYNGARAKAGGGLKATLFDRAAAVAIARSKEEQAGKVSPLTKAQYALFDKLVYSKIRQATGGRVRYAISGGAPLGERLGHFFNGLGLKVLEGYGLTETTAAATVNTPSNLRIGTVGRPIPGVSIRIADDGEVQVKGGIVFAGYYKNEAATAESFDDGWLCTGDIGTIDDDGFLRITGRKKDLIITAGGKNVQPAELEDMLQANPLVGQAMVVGDAKPFIAALVTLDPDELRVWATQHGRQVPDDNAEMVRMLADDPEVRAAIKKTIDEANARVSRAESIREFRILHRELTVEGGDLTPSLKVKRQVVQARFAEEIESIYEGKPRSAA
jgi:long-chain acyl-CoA synthetase